MNARAVLNRGHRESAAVGNVNASCISAECSRLPARTVVDAPLNASSAMFLHVSSSESEQVPSVPTISCGLEYPPCLSSDVLRVDLSPLNTCGSDGVPPIGVLPVSHHNSAFNESWGKRLGLVAAPLVGNAVTVPPLQKRAVQCNAISQSGRQSDTSTPLRVTDSLSRLRDLTGKYEPAHELPSLSPKFWVILTDTGGMSTPVKQTGGKRARGADTPPRQRGNTPMVYVPSIDGAAQLRPALLLSLGCCYRDNGLHRGDSRKAVVGPGPL